MTNIIVRVWPFDYESLQSYVCGHFPCHQVLKSDDLTCGVIVKSDNTYHVIICSSFFDNFDIMECN